jgi:sugar lactone lactonase YvrE
MNARPFALLLVASLAACGGGEGGEGEAEGEAEAATLQIDVANAGFMTPESVLHDAAGDVYLVANINGAPAEKDDNGFISQLSPEGQVTNLKWITGDSGNVALHAPKGMAIKGDTLYVADIDCVKMFVRTTGAPAGQVCLRGATFLNDVAVDGEGRLYVTDTGVNADFSDNDSDAIWRFSADGTASKINEGQQLGGPNGIAFNAEGAYVVSFGTGEIYQVGFGGERRSLVAGVADRQLDGIVFLNDGGYAFSSWGDRAVHQVNAAGTEGAILENVESPADIGYDAQRNRVLVPLFNANQVIIKEVPPLAAPAAF